MSAELEVFEPLVPATLIPAASPDDFLQQAGNVAKALVGVVKERKLSKQIGGREHIQVEAWTTLGSLLGSIPGGKSVFAVADNEPEFVEIDGIKGFRAHVSAVTIDGETVGAAWAYCMRDEPNWRGRPLHALAAMAETRATSRALRKPLGFIVELAGYSATAPEEMPAEGELILSPTGEVFPDQRGDELPQFTAPTSKAAQRRKANAALFATIGELVKAGKATEDELKTEIYAQYEVASTKDLSLADVEAVTAALKLRLA